MKVWVFTISFNESYFMPFFLRHYSTFADKIIVWDEHSTDGTRGIVKACPKAELRDWPYRGLDDDRFLEAQHNWYKEARGLADWAMWPDVDELLWHPNIREVLRDRVEQRFDRLNARGFALLPPKPPVDDGHSQFWELAKLGVPTENYDKSVVLNPGCDIRWDYGRHKVLGFNGRSCPQTDFRLLHCHFLGLVYTIARNKRNLDRCINKFYGWNYSKEHDHSGQAGTPSWLRDCYLKKKLINVLECPI